MKLPRVQKFFMILAYSYLVNVCSTADDPSVLQLGRYLQAHNLSMAKTLATPVVYDNIAEAARQNGITVVGDGIKIQDSQVINYNFPAGITDFTELAGWSNDNDNDASTRKPSDT